MGEHNIIYDTNGTIVGHFRLGVAWSKDQQLRLGEYDDVDDIEEIGYVYDDDHDIVAKYSDGVVMNMIGEPIGTFDDRKLIVESKIVGLYIGSSGAAAAAIALLFNRNGARGDR